MNGVWWVVVATALVTVAADEASDPEGLREPGAASDYEVVVGNWSECTSADEYRKKHGHPSLPVHSHNLDSNQIVKEFRPQMFDQEREVKCRHINGSYVDPSLCPGIESIETSRVCIVRQDCLLGEWLPWRQRTDGSLVRRRRLLKLPQGGGKDCDVVEEVRPLVYEPDVYWVQGAWGPCRVAMEARSEAYKSSSNNNDYMEDNDAMYNDEDEDEEAEELDDKESMQSSCGGGVQRREATCTRANGRALEPARCAHKPMPALVQPCEVPCPRDCEVGPWSEWGVCQPTDGCPLFPVQQLTTTGYSVRRRRVISASSGGGAPCPPLEEKRTCAAPRCAAWRALPWGPCVLNQPHAACGPGKRTRELRCVGHDGKEAQRAWCSGTGAPARSERCRIACGGDCVVSAWGAWSPCSATCAVPGHPPPTKTRRRHILAPASPNGWPCPSEEQMIQHEICNTHACATYSWLATPWGPCERRTTDYVPSNNYTELSNEEPFNESYEEEPCIEEGEMTRDVMCVQNNADVVREALCAPLRRPASRRACTVRCRRGCRLGPWMPWSPCPSDCDSQGMQTRRRLVHGGPNCGARQERRNCPRPIYCQPPKPSWVTGKWESCSVLKCGLGYTIRSIWCVSGTERVDASECAGQLMPPTVARCTRSCDRNEYYKTPRYTCDAICADPIKFLDTTQRYLPNCTCNNVSVIIPSGIYVNSSDCILPPGKECGEGKALISASCLIGERHVPMSVCKKFRPSIDHIPGKFAYDEEFPSSLRRVCYVECVRDCVVGPWGEWGPCAAEEGSRAAFRIRTREIVAEATGGGRECGATLQRATCTLNQPRWIIGEWSVCKPEWSLCGRTYTNRTVACVDEEGKHLDPSACELAWKGMAPAREAECRAPCPADCVVSTWSEWSPCERTKWGGRRDRTRVVLRPMAEGGMYCPPLVGGEPCAPYTYSWHVAPWDDCQPLGGSPCGEGIKRRSVRCLRSDGVFVNDSYCPNTTASEARESWCYVPCGVDCELGEWGAWDTASCLCGSTTSYMRRTRTRLTSAVWPGRACSPTEQRALCPREPCLRPVAAPVLGCRVLSIDGKQVENACGWGVKITHARCELSGGSLDATGGAHLLPWRCAPALPGRIIIPPSEYQEEACEVECGCKGSEAGKPGPWGAWGTCRGGARSRTRQLLVPPRPACNITSRFVTIEWANCTSNADEIPDLLVVETGDERSHRAWSNHDIYHDGYIEGGSSVLVVVWTATIMLSLYGTYMIYRGVIRCLRSRKMKTITKV